MISQGIFIRENYCFVLIRPDGTPYFAWQGHNIVTTAGEVYWRERMIAQAVPTNFTTVGGVFDGQMALGNAAVPGAPAKASNYSVLTAIVGAIVAPEATYPKLNDLDALNAGKGANIITIKYLFPASGSPYTGISQVVITNPTPGGTEPVLTYTISSDWNPVGPRTKPAADALAVFYNVSAVGIP